MNTLRTNVPDSSLFDRPRSFPREALAFHYWGADGSDQDGSFSCALKLLAEKYAEAATYGLIAIDALLNNDGLGKTSMSFPLTSGHKRLYIRLAKLRPGRNLLSAEEPNPR